MRFRPLFEELILCACDVEQVALRVSQLPCIIAPYQALYTYPSVDNSAGRPKEKDRISAALLIISPSLGDRWFVFRDRGYALCVPS